MWRERDLAAIERESDNDIEVDRAKTALPAAGLRRLGIPRRRPHPFLWRT